MEEVVIDKSLLRPDQLGLAGKLLLRPDEAGIVCGLARATIYKLIKEGQLPVVRIGRAVRISSTALRRWIDESTAPPRAATKHE